jgi:hypothetical protein
MVDMVNILDILDILFDEGHTIARFAVIGSLIGRYLAAFLIYSPAWSALGSFIIILLWPYIYEFIEDYILPVIYNRRPDIFD